MNRIPIDKSKTNGLTNIIGEYFFLQLLSSTKPNFNKQMESGNKIVGQLGPEQKSCQTSSINAKSNGSTILH